MATIEFQLESSGRDKIANFFKDFYIGGLREGMEEGGTLYFDATFSRQIPFGTPSNGTMTSSSFDVEMEFGDSVENVVLSSTAPEDRKTPQSYDMMLKSGQDSMGAYFQYGGIFRVNSVTITVTSV